MLGTRWCIVIHIYTRNVIRPVGQKGLNSFISQTYKQIQWHYQLYMIIISIPLRSAATTLPSGKYMHFHQDSMRRFIFWILYCVAEMFILAEM